MTKLSQIIAAAFSLPATVTSPSPAAAHSLRHRMLQTQFTPECIADTATLLHHFNDQRHSFMKTCPKSETWVGNTPFIDYRPCHPSFVNHLTDVCTAAGGFIVYHFEHLWNECQNTNTGEWTMVGTNGYTYECFANSCYALTWQPNFYYTFIHMMQSSGYHMHVYDCDTNNVDIPEPPSTPPVITEENSDDEPPIPPGEAVTEGPSTPPGEAVTDPKENSDDGLSLNRGGEAVTGTKEYSDDGNKNEVTGTEEDSYGSSAGTPTFIIVLAATSSGMFSLCTVKIIINCNRRSAAREMQEEG